MSAEKSSFQKERQMILDAKAKGLMPKLKTYTKLSGPGWLQSAITLGGGSLAGSLYLGVLGGFALLWLQPLAMIMGVIMLSAISYVTLSTGKRPFEAINTHVNPVLGWGWILATLMANMVWCLPQFSLGTAAIRQNLLRRVFTGGAGVTAMIPDIPGKIIICGVIAIFCTAMVWSYNSGGKGVKVFNIILKIMVGTIVVCFFGVVIKMSVAGKGLEWKSIFSGFIPNIKLLSSPAETFGPFLSVVGEKFHDFWHSTIVSQQRDVMITAAATAVGINMTFLLPYSMLKRGWNKDFRGLAIFDLSTGLFIPFILATGCVVIVASAQFHTKPELGFLGEKNARGEIIQPAPNIQGGYRKLALARIKYEMGQDTFSKLSEDEKKAKIEALPVADKRMAAMLVKRDAFNLARSLAPLTGKTFAHYMFGIGVLGMAVSTIIILMLINGFTVCEILGREWKGWTYRIGSLLPLVGIAGPFFWKQAKFWLAVPTSIFGMILLPIAYFTFYLLMNQKSLLGDDMPRGGKRVRWNVLMGIAAGLAAFGSIWSIWSKLKWTGIAIVIIFITLAVVVHFVRSRRKAA